MHLGAVCTLSSSVSIGQSVQWAMDIVHSVFYALSCVQTSFSLYFRWGPRPVSETASASAVLENSAGYWILDTGYWILATGYCPMPNVHWALHCTLQCSAVL